MAQLVQLADYQARRAAKELLGKGGKNRKLIVFSRSELNKLIAVYSRHVIAGDWKAYAIDHGEGAALFSVFQHALAKPLYSIVKLGGQRRNGNWLILSDGRRIRQNAEIDDALAYFDRTLKLV